MKNNTARVNNSRNNRKVRLLEPWIVEFISNRGLKIMRSVADKKPLNVSYSEDGLK